MRLLFEMDKKDYAACTHSFTRNSARSIIIRDKRIAMIHSRKYDYYAFPGGGIDRDESGEDALIREIREETGLEVIPESIREYGLIVRKEKGAIDDLFIQENYYYLCDVGDHVLGQELSGYEIDEDYELSWMVPDDAVRANLEHFHGKLSGEEWAAHLFRREEALIRKLEEDGLL